MWTRRISTADDFNRPLQELVTTYCWGECWGRPGLDRKTRSMLNLAMISALNRPHEVKAHVKGAINNGLTKNDIQEVFLQVAIYAAFPRPWIVSAWREKCFRRWGFNRF